MELHNRILIITSLVSIVLIVTSLIIPPTGVIDPSVLTAVGELFAFAALGEASYAMTHNKKAKIVKGDTTLEISQSEQDVVDEIKDSINVCKSKK